LQPRFLGLTRSPIGLLLVNLVMNLDIPANRVFGDPGIGRQDFQNLSPLIFFRVGVVNHRVCVRDNLDRVLTTRTANPHPRLKCEEFKLLEVESKKANESMQCEQLKNATVIGMEHLLDELG